jgi:hypothetical protein
MLLSGAALFAGLLLLTTAPISGVLIILTAMGLMLISAARFCGLKAPMEERQTEGSTTKIAQRREQVKWQQLDSKGHIWERL